MVFLALVMPGLDGVQVLQQLRVIDPHLRVVFLSCVGDTHKVAQAIRLGAEGYLTKPIVWHDMSGVIRRCLSSNRAELTESPTTFVEDLGNGNFFLAVSPALRKIRLRIDLLAKVPAPVLLLGETGTGKEVLAHLIHKISPRANAWAQGAIEQAEAKAITTILQRTNWNRTRAAAALEISYRSLLYKIRRYDIQLPSNCA